MYLQYFMYLLPIVLDVSAIMNIKMYFNPIAPQGKDHIIILTIDAIKDEWFQCKVHSKNYLIDVIEANKSDGKLHLAWQKSIDLVTTLNFFGIYPEEALEYYEGWYHIIKAKFWSFGTRAIVVDSSKKFAKKQQPSFNGSLIVGYQHSFHDCLPALNILNCPDYQKGGKKFDFSKPMIMQGAVTESCGDFDVNTPYNWMIYDVLGKVQYENLGYSLRPIWHFKPFQFSVSYVHNPVGMILVQLSTKIRDTDMRARCYLKPKKANIVAQLLGESKRVITAGSTFIIDARQSFDPWSPPRDLSYLRFRWRCYPLVEEENDFCSGLRNFSRPFLRLSTDDLPYSYKIIVHVSSVVDSKRRSSAEQFIKVVANYSKESHINCIENCEHNEFRPSWPIILQVQCLNCNKYERKTYKWFVSRKSKILSESKRLVYTPNPEDKEITFKVVLNITDTRNAKDSPQRSTATFKISKNNGPTVGLCLVRPTSGVELQTKFRIECSKFESKHTPLSYCVLSDEIPIGRCSSNPLFKIQFPKTKVASLLVCDSRKACVTKTLNIHVINYESKRNETYNTAVSVGNLRDDFTHGNPQLRFQKFLRLSKILTDEQEFGKLVYAMEAYIPRTPNQLMELVHFARNLIDNLQPLNNFKAMLLTKIVRIVSESFPDVIEGQLSLNINEKIFLNIAHSILYLVNSFMVPAIHIPRAQCDRYQADCVGFDDLTDNYEELETFDPNILIHIDNFLHLHWELQKCVFYIGKYSFKIVKWSDKKLKKYSFHNFGLEQHYLKIGKKDIRLSTSDHQHYFIFTKSLLEELEENLESSEMMVQIFHEIDNSMYWWYPQVHTPSTKLVWINIFSAKKTLNNTQLEQPLEVISRLKDLNRQHSSGDGRRRRRKRKPRQVVRSTPRTDDIINVGDGMDADQDYESDYDFIGDNENESQDENMEDYTINGYLDAPYQMQVFRTDLFSDSVLALKFLTASVDLLVTMTVNEPASTFAVKDSSCPLYSYRAYNTTFLMMNLCNKTMQAYIVVRSTLKDDDWEGMKDEAIEFSFELESRTCNDWSYDKPEPSWRTVACYPHMNTTLEKGIHCQCEYISQYNTKIVPMNAVAITGTGSGGARGAANRWFVMLFYVLVNIVLVVTLCILKSRVKAWDKLLPAVPYDHAKEDDGRGHIMVELQIGGRDQAGSTANLHISFLSDAGQHNFVVYRDYKNDHFNKNETITLRLQKSYVKLPTMLALGHDNVGSTPHYYVRNIIVRDLDKQMTQEFRVEQWIHNDQEFYMRSRCFTGGLEAHTELYNWRWQFKKAMEFHFNNWFLFQPLLGPWRSGMNTDALNKYERCCVWTCKFAITLCIVSCVFGRSTTHACETTKKAYYEPAFIIPLALSSFIVSCIVHSILVKLIKSSHKHAIEIW